MAVNRVLVCLLVVLIICTILQYELHVKDEFDIIQTQVSDITDKMLQEKLPIVIHERIVDLKDLVTKVFKYQYMTCVETTRHAIHKVHKNVGRFTILQSLDVSGCAIVLRNPHYENTTTLLLQIYQVVVIPRYWAYTIEKGSVQQFVLRDIISYLFI